jgi:hypothetical protein
VVDESLVLADRSDEDAVRHRMPETLRQYARERLVANGAENSSARRHADYYLALALRAELQLTGAEQQVWFQRLEQEHDNLRLVLHWAKEAGELDVGFRLGAALGGFWWVRGHLSEGRAWLDPLLAGTRSRGSELAPARAEARTWTGRLARDQGDLSQAAALFAEGLALCRALGDKQAGAMMLGVLGSVPGHLGGTAGRQPCMRRA